MFNLENLLYSSHNCSNDISNGFFSNGFGSLYFFGIYSFHIVLLVCSYSLYFFSIRATFESKSFVISGNVHNFDKNLHSFM